MRLQIISNRVLLSILVLLSLFVGGLTALALYVKAMSSSSEPKNDLLHTVPFLTNANAIEYVQSSKLMVLVFDQQDDVFEKISTIYGTNASCISEADESKRIADVQYACTEDRHLIAIDAGMIKISDLTSLQPYTQLGSDNNYIVSLLNTSEGILPQYVGWHLNEADSCMLGLCANALLEDLLLHVSEFCSDFRNFSQSDTIAEMLKYYELAASNQNGMLHCTANYFGSPTPSLKEYFERVKGNITMNYENTIIGLVFTPRTFGARVKLSSEQLKLWGGDEVGIITNTKDLSVIKESHEVHSLPTKSPEKSSDTLSFLSSALSRNSIKKDCEEAETTASMRNAKFALSEKKSCRYFPNSQASLVYLSSQPYEDEPDFHPITGPGHKAHMTIGVAPGVSAVTTGSDLLEIVDLEKQQKEWPTYSTSRGWLRDYGESRWVLYMNNKIFVDSMFAGVYVIS